MMTDFAVFNLFGLAVAMIAAGMACGEPDADAFEEYLDDWM